MLQVDNTDYAARMMQFAQSNMDKLSRTATERQKEGESSASAYFLYYVDYDQATNSLFSTEKVPQGKSGPTSKGGKWYKKNAEVLLTDITPTGDVSLDPETGVYTVVAKVTVQPKTADSVLAYLRETKDTIYYDAENDKVRSHITYTIKPNMQYSVSIMVYSEQDLNNLHEVDPRVKKLKIRQGKQVKLRGATFGIYLKTYQRDVRRGKEGEKETVFSDEFGITCEKMQLDNSGDSSELGTLSSIYHSLFPKDTTFLYDIKDVLNGVEGAVIPSRCYIYTSVNKVVDPDSQKLIRITDYIKDRGDVLKNYDTDKQDTRIQARFTCTDIYPKEEKTYIVQFTGYKGVCEDTGLDTLDFYLWADLMQSHTFSSHFLCKYSEKATLSLTANQLPVVNMRDKGGENNYYTHGTYVFTVTQWVMDWEDTLKARGIRITRDTFLKTFKEANAGLNSAEKRFKVATVDGNDELVFESVLPYSNPILNDGMYSKVINFGSGSRPTFSCSDASPILNHEGAEFYALTGIKTEDTAPWSTPEEGSAVFEQQLKEHNVKYQLFVIQNLDREQKK